MKKLLLFLILSVMLLSLAACGAKTDDIPVTVPETSPETVPETVPQTVAETESEFTLGKYTVYIVPDTEDLGAVTSEQISLAKECVAFNAEALADSGFKPSIYADLVRKHIVVTSNDPFPEGAEEYLISLPSLTFRSPDGEILMDGSYVDNAQAASYFADDFWINISFNEEGRQKFAEITERYINKQIYIYLNDILLSAPTVNDAITDGNALISGDFNAEEAVELANRISCSTIPFSLRVSTLWG